MSTVRWHISVSPDIDQALRMYLAGRGSDRKGDLSRFIEEAVRARILELSAEQAKAANAEIQRADLTTIVTEAVGWARSRE